MNNAQKSSKKPYVIIAIVVIIGVIAYFYYQGTIAPTSTTLSESDIADQAVGAQVLDLLHEINSLKIDTALFKDPAFLTLRDYTVIIPALPVGRVNPFAPLPGDFVTKSTHK